MQGGSNAKATSRLDELASNPVVIFRSPDGQTRWRFRPSVVVMRRSQRSVALSFRQRIHERHCTATSQMHSSGAKPSNDCFKLFRAGLLCLLTFRIKVNAEPAAADEPQPRTPKIHPKSQSRYWWHDDSKEGCDLSLSGSKISSPFLSVVPSSRVSARARLVF